DMLDIEKIDSGKFELKMSGFEVRQLFEVTADSLRHYAAEKTIKIEIHNDRPLWIKADFDRVVQVLTNLVANAVKFSPNGSTVRVRAMKVDARRIRISVHDEGPGISEANKARLFGRFQQIDSTDRRQHGGTGLGLAICKAIIEQHGGTIDVQSELGQGSTFYFELNAFDMESDGLALRVDQVET
ncbi:MAG TPA: ATP-binding protein, partial [Polyangium sp.]|nr:ATP-binding protein [Polyangium sp.]